MRDVAGCIWYGLLTIQRAIEVSPEEREICPTSRLDRRRSFKIASDVARSRPLTWRMPFASKGVMFHGQAAGVIEAVARGCLSPAAERAFTSCLERLVRIFDDPSLELLRFRMPNPARPADLRHEIEIYESVFETLRLHHTPGGNGKPSIIWIDSMSYPDGGLESEGIEPVAGRGGSLAG